MSGPYGAAAAFAGVDACIDPRGAEHAGTRLPPWGEAVSGPDL